MGRKRTLKLEKKYKEDEKTTMIFKVSKDTASHFENWGGFISFVDDTHISVNARCPLDVLHDEFLSVGLNPDQFNL